MKSENCCLTIEQAKELQALGVNMSDSMMVHFNLCGAKIICERYNLSGTKDCIDTLTNTEMLEMLPENLFGFDGYDLQIIKERNNTWTVRYCKYDGKNKVFYDRTANKLRDALFEMIKRLKFNKLM